MRTAKLVVTLVAKVDELVICSQWCWRAPRCGKTTLAEALAKRKSIPFFSADHLGALITPYIPSDQQDDAFPLLAARAVADRALAELLSGRWSGH